MTSLSLMLLIALSGEPRSDVVSIELYVQPGCGYCKNAEVFLDELSARRPGIVVERCDVRADPTARARLKSLIEAEGLSFALPAIVVRDKVLVGFDGPIEPENRSKHWRKVRRSNRRRTAVSAPKQNPATSARLTFRCR